MGIDLDMIMREQITKEASRPIVYAGISLHDYMMRSGGTQTADPCNGYTLGSRQETCRLHHHYYDA